MHDLTYGHGGEDGIRFRKDKHVDSVERGGHVGVNSFQLVRPTNEPQSRQLWSVTMVVYVLYDRLRCYRAQTQTNCPKVLQPRSGVHCSLAGWGREGNCDTS